MRCNANLEAVDPKGNVFYLKRVYEDNSGLRHVKIYDGKCRIVEDYRGLLTARSIEGKISIGEWKFDKKWKR